jgi:hypothetical protein
MKIRGFLIVLLLALVIVYALYFVKTGKKSMIRQDIDAYNRMTADLTNTIMTTLGREIDSYVASEGSAPANIQEFLQKHMVTTGLFDAWGTEIKYERVSDDHFRLVSAGKDRKMGTADDITREF